MVGNINHKFDIGRLNYKTIKLDANKNTTNSRSRNSIQRSSSKAMMIYFPRLHTITTIDGSSDSKNAKINTNAILICSKDHHYKTNNNASLWTIVVPQKPKIPLYIPALKAKITIMVMCITKTMQNKQQLNKTLTKPLRE